MPGEAQGRVGAWDIYSGVLPTELIAQTLGVDEKTATSGALGNTYIGEICFTAASNASPLPPGTTPLPKVKLQFKNSFPPPPS